MRMPKLFRFKVFILGVAVLVLCRCVGSPSKEDETRMDVGNNGTVASGCTVKNFKTDGSIGAKWNATTRTLAYGRADKEGSYKVFLADENGKQERPLTRPDWPASSHQFPIDWVPSGKYLFVTVEKAEHPGSHTDAIPGYGAYTDLWLVTRDGTRAWKLVDVPNDFDHGMTHGKISKSGKKFTWTARVRGPDLLSKNLLAGAYVFNVADFVETPTPHFENIVPYKPGNGEQGGEVDGMSDDGKTIAYYSTFVTKDLFNSRIYTTDLETGKVVELSRESYSQSPIFTPDGKGLIYMSGQEVDTFFLEFPGADWWYVRTDGSGRRRLTYMNQRDSPHSVNHYRLAGSLTLLSNTTFLGDVLTYPFGLNGKIVKVTCPAF